MMMDAMKINHDYSSKCSFNTSLNEESNIDVVRFFKFLKDSNEPLWDMCMTYNKLFSITRAFTIKSYYRLSENGCDHIIEWLKTYYFKEIGWKRTSMLQNSWWNLLAHDKKKNNMRPNFNILYHGEYANFTTCKTCQHAWYKPYTGRGRTLVEYKNWDASQSVIECKGHLCLQRLLSTWHDIIHIMRLMKSWCIFFMVKFGSNLIICILSFQWNHKTYILVWV